MKVQSPARSAFSLIEMLVVIAIIGIIAVMAIPTMKMVRGTDVSRAAQMVSDQLAAARQTAVAKNKQIEIRFLRFADPEQPGESVTDQSTWKVRGMQLMEVTASGVPVPIAPMKRLPGTMMLNEGKYSTLFDDSGSPGQTPLRFRNPTALDPAMPRLAADQARRYSYASFRFYPDGSTTLSVKENWYLTMHNASDSGPIETVDYYCIQIDPVSGATHVFRPALGG